MHHVERHDLIFEDRDLLEHSFRLIGILHRGKLYQDAIDPHIADRRLGNTQSVDATVDDLAGLGLNLRRNLRHFGSRIELEQEPRAALQVEAEVDRLLDGRHGDDRNRTNGDNNQCFEWRLEIFPVHSSRWSLAFGGRRASPRRPKAPADCEQPADCDRGDDAPKNSLTWPAVNERAGRKERAIDRRDTQHPPR